jgi:hypothetical protein
MNNSEGGQPAPPQHNGGGEREAPKGGLGEA